MNRLGFHTGGWADANRLGTGGFGDVYRGRLADGRFSGDVAIKRAHRDSLQGSRAAWNPIQDTAQRECSGTNFWGISFQSSRPWGARTNGPSIVGNEFDWTAERDFEEFLGYPKEAGGGIPRRSREFEAEIRTLERMRDPSLVRLLGHASLEDERCLVYELCDGGTLEDALGSPRPPDWDRVESRRGVLGYPKNSSKIPTTVKSNSFPTILGPFVFAPRVLDD